MTVREAINTRRSTRYYELDQKISSENMELIIEAGRKAPSGFGSEPWKFIVLTGDMSKIASATFGQAHVQAASHVVVLANYKLEYIEEYPQIITENLAAKGMSSDKIDGYVQTLKAKGTQYYREQTMFAASQMVLQATGLGIGSVIVGGFNPIEMAEVIGLDTSKYDVALVIDFGYPIKAESKPRTLRSKEQVVSYMEL